MPSLINSDDGVVSGSAGLKTTGSNDGILALQNNGTTAVTIAANGNVNFAVSGQRITGDFSNATVANRVMFQTSAANSNTTVRAIPSGSGANAGWIADNNSDVTNSSFAQFGIVGTTDVRIQSAINGTGTYLPMTFYTGGVETARIAVNGDFSFNSGYGSSAVAYGCRAWVNFNGVGTVSIRASGNVSTITDGGVGIYTVNFSNAMPDVNYATLGTVLFGSIGNKGGIEVDSTGSNPTTTTTRLRTYTSSAAQADCAAVYVSIFR